MVTRIDTVFLDRDGVINRKLDEGSYVTNWSEFSLLPGVTSALRRLTTARVRTVIVTNQRAVARGLLSTAELREIHGRMSLALAAQGIRIDGVYACEHEVDTCACRKPAVGLFLRAKRDDPAIEFERSAVVGDSASDIRPGHDLGCRVILVGPPGRRAVEVAKLRSEGVSVDLEAASLCQAVDFILSSESPA